MSEPESFDDCVNVALGFFLEEAAGEAEGVAYSFVQDGFHCGVPQACSHFKIVAFVLYVGELEVLVLGGSCYHEFELV